MLSTYETDVYLHALGWAGGPTRAVHCSEVGVAKALPILVALRGDGTLGVRDEMSIDSMLAPLDKAVLKASKIARARSAAQCTVFACLLATSLAPYAKGEDGKGGQDVALGVVCSSAIVPIFWRYEPVGLTQGWHMTDTTLLPASIPSAVGTACSMVTGYHAAAMTFGDGALGVIGAVDFAASGFANERFGSLLLVASDEASPPMLEAGEKLGVNRAILDGSSGFVLTARRRSAGDLRVAFAGVQARLERGDDLPEGWAGAQRVRGQIPDGYTMYTGNLLPQLLLLALQATTGPKVIVELELAGRAMCRIGLESTT